VVVDAVAAVAVDHLADCQTESWDYSASPVEVAMLEA